MHELHELKEKLISELKKYSSKDMSASTLEMVDKLAHAVKNLCKVIEDMDGYSDRGGSYEGSYRGGSYRGGSSRGGSYYGGTPYAMDYAGARGRGGSSRGYSNTGELASELRELMDGVRDQNTRADFERLIEKVERM